MRKKSRLLPFLISASLLIGTLSPMGSVVTKAAAAEADRADKSIVYFVDAGDYVTNTVCKGELLMRFQHRLRMARHHVEERSLTEHGHLNQTQQVLMLVQKKIVTDIQRTSSKMSLME